jgi:triacylglycerol lipase
MRSIATFFLFTVASASPIARGTAPTYAFDGDAPFSVDAETLAAALTCPRGNPTTTAPPVLLVHGTATTGAQSWEKGYVPALAANGYTPCYVTLPSRAMDDMQKSSEYVAYSIHYLSALSGGLKPAIVSHSQGGPVSQWALQFWPSTRSVARAFVPLAPDFAGIDLAISDLSAICDLIDCQPSLWQQSEGSKYYKALHAGDFRALVPTTSIWSKVCYFASLLTLYFANMVYQADGVVTPSEKNADLPDAKVVSVGKLCPLRIVNHVYMTVDSAAFALALDALDHEGTASVSRLVPKVLSICARVQAKNMDPGQAFDLTALFKDFLDGFM